MASQPSTDHTSSLFSLKMAGLARQPPRQLGRCCCHKIVFLLFLVLGIPVLRDFTKPHLPDIYLTNTATVRPLSTTSNVTWNLSINFDNPSRFWSISYQHVNISLFYGDHDSIAHSGLGGFFQRESMSTTLHPNFTICVAKLKKNVASGLLKDQVRGGLEVELRGYFVARTKETDMWTTVKFICYLELKFYKCDGCAGGHVGIYQPAGCY